MPDRIYTDLTTQLRLSKIRSTSYARDCEVWSWDRDTSAFRSDAVAPFLSTPSSSSLGEKLNSRRLHPIGISWRSLRHEMAGGERGKVFEGAHVMRKCIDWAFLALYAQHILFRKSPGYRLNFLRRWKAFVRPSIESETALYER